MGGGGILPAATMLLARKGGVGGVQERFCEGGIWLHAVSRRGEDGGDMFHFIYLAAPLHLRRQALYHFGTVWGGQLPIVIAASVLLFTFAANDVSFFLSFCPIPP